MAKIKDESVKQTTWTSELQLLMEQMNAMRQEMEDLKAGKRNKANEKEHYKWPRTYSYTLLDWVPVLDYKSVKKDSYMDWQYVNKEGHLISNQVFELTIAEKDDKWEYKVVRIDADSFNRNRVKSEKIEAEAIIGSPENPKWYQFTNDQFWTFIISSKIIN